MLLSLPDVSVSTYSVDDEERVFRVFFDSLVKPCSDFIHSFLFGVSESMHVVFTDSKSSE